MDPIDAAVMGSCFGLERSIETQKFVIDSVERLCKTVLVKVKPPMGHIGSSKKKREMSDASGL